MSDILEFRGDYRWLSNMTPCIVTLDGVAYRSVEHAYMSAKSDDAEWKEFCVSTQSPTTVKQQSKRETDFPVKSISGIFASNLISCQR